MASVPLTDVSIRCLKPRPGKQIDVYDSKITGLALRVSPGGKKSFVFNYRVGRTKRRLTMGPYPTLTLAAARAMAQEALTEVARGLDPQAEKLRGRMTYESSLFPASIDDFVENYARRNTKTWRDAQRILQKKFAKPWKKLPVHQITKPMVNAVLDEIVKRDGPSAANHALAAIRKFFNWLVDRGQLDHSPCAGIKAPCKVSSRDRVLSDDELRAIWLAADRMGWPFGSHVKLQILTGQRRSEVAGCIGMT